ncbi:ATP synthase F1 subunit delta [Aureitalea marina]|uniref:ATP synthase subunit delta n=1 Tax=Aureitalea marina TaxID=930804 RepID=A0A2S7KSA1_9FLAO|nr:ATP synthase F1 subunit delta [Aureitalea marina]PQB05509.1 ATP synthase F1 subunit delta [Aureitalea marina]
MSGSKVAGRYAKAILDQAQEAGVQDAVFTDMQSIAQTIDGSKELRLMLQSPVIKIDDKKEALEKIFSNSASLTQDLFRVLAINERMQALRYVAARYIDLYNEEKGIQVAHVTTAVELSEGLEKEVLNKVCELTGSNNVTIENKIDPSIIGGFILRVGDLQYNASIANQLGSLKREFSKSL